MGTLVEGVRVRWAQAKLNQRVAVLVGLWVLVSAVIGGSVASWYVQRVTVLREAEVVSEFVRGQVDGTRIEELLRQGGSSRSVDEIGSLMHGLQAVRAIRRIKMYDRQARIVWSDNPNIIGIPSSGARLPVAMAGTLSHNFEIPQDPEHTLDVSLAQGQPLLEVFVPILGRIPERPVAVVEVYKEAVPLLDRVWHARLAVWGGVFLSGCLAMGTVLLIIRQVSVGFQRAQRRLEADLRALVETLGTLADLKDPFVDGHTRRVQALAAALAAEMGIPAQEVEMIGTAARLHDVGKIGVAEAAWAKSGPLIPADWKRIKAHPGIGADIIAAIEQLQPARGMIRHHHERYDGFGYPARLLGESIPLGARIISVADAFVAMTSARPHRVRIPARQALEEIRREAGQQFDPTVVAALERLAERQGVAGLMELGAAPVLGPASV